MIGNIFPAVDAAGFLGPPLPPVLFGMNYAQRENSKYDGTFLVDQDCDLIIGGMDAAACMPPEEQERLEALRRYGPFGLLRAAVFDDISRLAAFICKTPISLITLIDANRQWFLSQSGVGACETSREASFCAHALIGPETLIVEDAQTDARFARNVMVTGAPFIRFYAGTPLLTPDGYALGTLCVVDCVPRVLTPEQRESLQSLGRLVMAQLETARLKRELRILQQSFTSYPSPRGDAS